MDSSKPSITNSEDIQAKLEKKLGPEYISKRVGFGSSRVAYIEGWKAINLANQIFGYNGWSTEVKSITVDFMDERQGKFCIGCTAIVRVTLTDGTFREDIGYGTVENERRKSSAFERSKKSAVTDALKRSLRSFGNALGNCLYDKSFLAKIDKVKFDPPDFDEGNLYRATDEVNEVSRTNTVDYDGAGPPSKRRNMNRVGDTRPASSAYSTPSNGGHQHNGQQQHQLLPPPPQQQTAVPQQPQQQSEQDPDELLDDSFMFSDEIQDEDIVAAGSANGAATPAHDQANTTIAPLPPVVQTPSVPPNSVQQTPVTFVTARAAPNLQNRAPVPEGSVFDPKFRAQSIKHTVDQTTSSHVKSSLLRDKGISNKRNAIYDQFAPRGKLIGDTNGPVDSPVSLGGRQPLPTTISTNPQLEPASRDTRPGHNLPLEPKGTPVQTGNHTSTHASSPVPTMRTVGKPKSTTMRNHL